MKVIRYIVLFFSAFFTFGIFACDLPQADAFKSIPVDGGAIVFDFVSIEKETGDTSQTQEVGIDINLFKCSDGTRKLVGQLPYLSSTGQVRDAFLYAPDGVDVKRLFVIHSVEIRSDTGVKYSGDYYSVNVYKVEGDSYVRDDRLSTYFGDGGDILAENYKGLLYEFPYKNKSSVLEKLKSKLYRAWRAGTPVSLVINKKTPIYGSPVLADVTRMYLVEGDKVWQDAVEAGWLSIIYRTSKGKEIRGWIQCGNADGC